MTEPVDELSAPPAPSFEYMCSVPKQYWNISRVANYIDSVVTLVVPFCVISFFNMRIAICVWNLRKHRETIVARRKYSRPVINEPTRKGHSSSSSGPKRFRRNCGSSSTGSQRKLLLLCNGKNREEHACSTRLVAVTSSFPDNARGNETCQLCSNHIVCELGEKNSTVVELRENKEFELSDERTGSHGSSPLETQRNSLGPKMGKNVATGSRGGAPDVSDISVHTKKSSAEGHSSGEVRVTKMLLLVSTVFLVLNLPSHAIRAVVFVQVCLLFITLCFFIVCLM